MPQDFRSALHEVRERLADYADLLWEGRLSAPPALSGVYTERLA
jgi:hypothetical protein